MKTKHTPTPWRTGDLGLTIFGPPNGEPSPKTIAHLRNQQDGQFILRAVNNHAELLEALKWVQNGGAGQVHYNCHCPICAAIAKAEGES